MLNISSTSMYALRGLLYLLKNSSSDGHFVKIEEIAKAENIPLNYLRKIFQQLIKNRIVQSAVGPKGGIKPAENIDEIRTAQIIKIFDGEPILNNCTLFGTSGCFNIKICPIHSECFNTDNKIWKKLVNFKIVNFL